MEKVTLKAQKRDIVGKKVNKLRQQGKIPAVLYGQGKVGENLTLDHNEFIKAYKQAGGSTLVDLKIDDKNPIKILIHEPQYNPVTDKAIHVDLYKIKMDEEITTQIPLEFIGESLAVKEQEGNLIKNKDAVEVKCLPGDLIPNIEVDITILKTFDDTIHIKDLKVSDTIKIQDNPEETVAVVNPPISEEELEAMEKESAADEEKEEIEKMETEAEAEKEAKEKEEGKEDNKEGKEKPKEGEQKSDNKNEKKKK